MHLQQAQRHAKCIHLSFQDFLFDASEELGNFLLPGGEQVHVVSGVIKTLTQTLTLTRTFLCVMYSSCVPKIWAQKANKSVSPDEESTHGDADNCKRKRKSGVTKYRHRVDWVNDRQKQRCRLASVWRIMSPEDDGQLHLHQKVVVGDKKTTRCVLCCRHCFDPTGSVYDRNSFHATKGTNQTITLKKTITLTLTLAKVLTMLTQLT
jgi:hypothetical protein